MLDRSDKVVALKTFMFAKRGGWGTQLLFAAAMVGCGSGSGPSSTVDGGPVTDANGTMPDPEPAIDAHVIIPPGATDADNFESGGTISVTRQAQMVSVPPSFVLATDEYSYTPKHSRPGDTQWNIVSAPPGVAVRERRLVADPGTLPPGEHTVVIEAMVEDSIVRQRFPLTVAMPVQRAARLVTPAESTQVAVQSEVSRVRRSAVAVPEGAVDADTVISISEVDRLPPRPSFSEAGPVVDFGPSGTVFRKRATVSLPLDSAMTDAKKVGAFTFNTKVGRWEPVEVLGIDKANKLVIAKASHFSMYMAAESAFTVQSNLGVMPAPPRCEGSLSVQSILNASQTEIPASGINNLSPEMKDLLPPSQDLNADGLPDKQAMLSDLLLSRKFRGTLRVVFVTTLYEGEKAERVQIGERVIASSVFVAEDGAVTVTLTDALGNVIETAKFADLAKDMPMIWPRLSGASAHAIFSDVGKTGVATASRVHLLYFPDDRTADGISTDDLGLTLVESVPGEGEDPKARAADFDLDCDELVGAFDAKDGRFVPSVQSEPAEVAAVFTGETVRLTATVFNVGATPPSKWDAGGGTLAPSADDPGSQHFSALKPGRYTVTFTASVTGSELSHAFVIDVTSPPVVNTPPSCAPVAGANAGVVGDTVAFEAVVDDKESPVGALSIDWGLLSEGSSPTSTLDDTLVASGLIKAKGRVASLSLLSPGTFVVGCRAYDGKAWGPIAYTSVGAVAKGVNQAPVDSFLSPAIADLLVGQNVRLVMNAQDPEGKPLTFTWKSVPNANSRDVPLLGTPEHFSAHSEIVFAGTEAGVYEVHATASDGEFSSPTQTAKIVVRDRAPSKIDMDNDGFSSGTAPGEDCNDGDKLVNPDVAEVCGNLLDENCDGVVAKDDCDRDGYASCATKAPGDCDCNDSDPTMHPGVRERCDGRDNNCNAKIDEDFGIGAACTVGLGQCQWAGKFLCSPDGYRALCAGVPLAAVPEVCDGRDNDCDGQVDEDSICIKQAVGVFFECAVPMAGQDPAKFANCAILDNEGFQLRDDGTVVLLSAPAGVLNFDPKVARYCWYNQGTWRLTSPTTLLVRLPDTQTGMVQENIIEIVKRTPEHLTIAFADAGPNMSKIQDNRRIAENTSGKCDFDVECRQQSEYCNGRDDDCDGKIDEDLVCPPACDKDQKDNNANGMVDEPGEPCSPPPVACDKDLKDNNGNGMIDERGEPCSGTTYPTCEFDRVDNNGNGMIDEPGEPCSPMMSCDRDMRDNNGNGMVDEVGEPCSPPPVACDKDLKDNNGNGMVDEPGEPCSGTTYPTCEFDRVDNNGNGMIDEPGEPCGPMMACDRDGMDNNGNGLIDEQGESCSGPVNPSCDKDGMDNNGNGMIDEPGEPCGPMMACDRDMRDNNGNGMVDEPGEPCSPPPVACDKDLKDNNGNGLIDEPGEPCNGTTYPTCEFDRVDNNGNGMIDEPGEPCGPMMSCDKDMKDNNGNGMIDEPGEPCGPMMSCDKDLKDNNGNGMVDEPGEPCSGTTYPTCEFDRVDNNGNGMIDEPGEPCGPMMACDRDGMDNNGNGLIDEQGESCSGPVNPSCDKDGMDNNGNGMIDEPGEACGPMMACDKDGTDNNGNGLVDEQVEPCSGPTSCDRDGMDNNGNGLVDEQGELCGQPMFCDKDGIDNNGNGMVDEQGEPCGPPPPPQ